MNQSENKLIKKHIRKWTLSNELSELYSDSQHEKNHDSKAA